MDNKLQKIFERYYREIRNRIIVEIYPKVADLITQKEFAKRVGIDAGKLSHLIAAEEYNKK